MLGSRSQTKLPEILRIGAGMDGAEQPHVFRHYRIELAGIHCRLSSARHMNSRPKFGIFCILGANPMIGNLRN